ncbi:Adenosylhomocysteinase [Thelohanellus kitauei]|uniref:Adenosylhomocysteinase n=1 Tax=Thelohanellus kitauei TaxID=669202 RepID=A0A0C2MCN7_THEKT|nr:Adenosylhomocysteinase [Thelohanellus kitauei]
MEGYKVTVLDDIISEADIVITATGNINIVTEHHISKMKDNAILGNTGHFDYEVDAKWIAENAVSHVSVKPQLDIYTFASGKSVILLAQGRLVNLSCADGHPSFVMSATFSNMFLAAVELCQSPSNKYEPGIYLLPKTVMYLL